MRAIPVTILRGGSSKGIYILENELPQDKMIREKVILSIFGSPDKRQIDGLGGADPLTSKVAVVGPSKRHGIDVDYTFGQVGIDEAKIFSKSICGNISSGVGPFAIDQGLVKAVEPITTVRIYNTNTEKIFVAKVPVIDGKAAVEGNYSIAGVPGKGAKVSMDFSNTVGALTGELLPTGNIKDEIEVDGLGRIPVSIVDLATCQVFVRAEDIGLSGIEAPNEIDSNHQLIQKLEEIRCKAAVMAGMASTHEDASIKCKNTPHLVFFSEAQNYINFLTLERINAVEIDFVARMMFMQKLHKAYAGTGSICTAAASIIPGTVINHVLKKEANQKNVIRIGHPAGIISIEVKSGSKKDGYRIESASIGRTARKIMDGLVYVRESVFNE